MSYAMRESSLIGSSVSMRVSLLSLRQTIYWLIMLLVSHGQRFMKLLTRDLVAASKHAFSYVYFTVLHICPCYLRCHRSVQPTGLQKT